MGATAEWDCIPFQLITPQGTLNINQENALGDGTGYYLLRPAGCSMGAPLRVSVDDVAATDGAVPHEVLTSGYRVSLTVEYWEAAHQVAMGEVLVAMNDLLMRHLNRCRADGQGRLQWNPSGDGNAERMVDDLWWIEDLEEDFEGDGPGVAVKFGFVSPDPYAKIAAQTTTAVADGATETLDNEGSAPFKPVMKVYGATSEFTITNETSDKVFHYDASQSGAIPIPGGGQYAELNFLRDTAYLNGDGASLKSGIDVIASEFFDLEIGENDLTIDGASMDVLWQSAYA